MIDIIIPAYNSHDTIIKTLSSLPKKQTISTVRSVWFMRWMRRIRNYMKEKRRKRRSRTNRIYGTRVLRT